MTQNHDGTTIERVTNFVDGRPTSVTSSVSPTTFAPQAPAPNPQTSPAINPPTALGTAVSVNTKTRETQNGRVTVRTTREGSDTTRVRREVTRNPNGSRTIERTVTRNGQPVRTTNQTLDRNGNPIAATSSISAVSSSNRR